jgi:anaerobic selenocysteine-containing dehydrogenase
MDKPNQQTSKTMCPMNCHPTFCGMTVTHEDNKLLDIRGDKENPDSQGFLCVRGQAAQEIIGNDNRILYPMVREQRGSDSWRQISWDEALDFIADRIKAVDNDSVAIWPGHGSIANDYGTFAHVQLALRLACMYGMQVWDPSMICWGLGGFGIGLTGVMQTNTKEDMGKNSDMIVLWGANIASQPNTTRHITAAKKRGARIIAIDVRVSEACKMADEYFIVKPGTDAALALAMMNTIVSGDLHDEEFINAHTVGFDSLKDHLQLLTPEWAASITGIDAERINTFALSYAETERAMIIIGGSSMYKDENGWQSSRAISCLPALTGKLGSHGTGIGPRHAGTAHGFGLNHIMDPTARPEGNYIPNQMTQIIEAIESGRIRAMILFGTNMLSSYADANRIKKGFDKMDLIVHHDLFMNDTAREFADIVLPGTSWLEDVGVKATATHLYLMDKILEPAGETRSMTAIVRALAERLEVEDFYPWEEEYGHIDAVLDHPSTNHATIKSLREGNSTVELNISHVAHIDHQYTTPSGKIEFYSEVAEKHGVSPLPEYQPRPDSEYPLELRTGRTLNHFHSFYDHGRALPSIKKLEKGPTLWVSKADADSRGIEEGASILISNDRGSCHALAMITDKVPSGVVWMHDGWPGFNTLTSGARAVPDSAINIFPFSVGQAAFDAKVDISNT